MAERDIPNSLSPDQAKKPDQKTRLSRIDKFGKACASAVPATRYTSKSVKQHKESRSENNVGPSKTEAKPTRWVKSWVWWTVILTLIPGTITLVALAMLLKLPSAPNCPKIFWPLASASVRLHCAQLAASKQTVNDLLQAIALVRELPPNHPLRGEIDQFLAEWSQDILQLADQSFQAGNLNEAIATARQIPQDMKASQLADEQIQKWQTIWSGAEQMYHDTEKELGQRHWQSAFMLAAKMLRVDNKYWASTKYDQLNQLITTAREDGDKLGKAENLAASGRADNILQAIQIAESIEQSSYLYKQAKDSIPTFGRKMLALAQSKMDKRDADGALEIAREIPEIAGLQTEINDFIALGEAKQSAWIGSISGLQEAISQAQQIDNSRAIYPQAQELIARWQLEIQDINQLEQARTLASQGSIDDLTAAIAEAQNIPAQNPRGKEARQEIEHWNGEIETIQDQPYLDRAQQMASSEDEISLQAAITEASQIRQGRALYPQARKQIRTWQSKIERIQDQPYLDQARTLADSGDLKDAITTAQPIASSGRALSGEAQASIDGWQEQIRSQENWRKAREVAQASTPEALVEAMHLANQVSNQSNLRTDANIAIDQWSEQLLDIARSQGQSNMETGIEIAKLVPRHTAAYNDAQKQIQVWQQSLNPQPEPSPVQPSSTISPR